MTSAEAFVSDVVWSTNLPAFAHQHTLPLVLDPITLAALQDGICVLEVWDRCGNLDASDRLVGLVKLPCHDLYLAYRDTTVAAAVLQSELPVLACNDFKAIVNPVTGRANGALRVVLAAGSQSQIMLLARSGGAGTTSACNSSQDDISRLHRTTVSFETHGPRAHEPDDADVINGFGDAEEGDFHPLHVHSLTVTVEAASNLQLFEHALYGETDCYVQHTFPEADLDRVESTLLARATMSGSSEELADLDTQDFVVTSDKAHR
jgi:C2 domain-containing protein 3